MNKVAVARNSEVMDLCPPFSSTPLFSLRPLPSTWKRSNSQILRKLIKCSVVFIVHQDILSKICIANTISPLRPILFPLEASKITDVLSRVLAVRTKRHWTLIISKVIFQTIVHISKSTKKSYQEFAEYLCVHYKSTIRYQVIGGIVQAESLSPRRKNTAIADYIGTNTVSITIEQPHKWTDT